MVFSWLHEKTVKPVEDYIFLNIENEGYLFVHECKERKYSTIIEEIRKAKQINTFFGNDLPTVDETFYYYNKWENEPAIALMLYGSKYLGEKGRTAFTYGDKIRYEYEKKIIDNNIKIYDLVDDVKRKTNLLYEKRIKLYQIKELTGEKDYKDIKLPHVVPPEFIPYPEK